MHLLSPAKPSPEDDGNTSARGICKRSVFTAYSLGRFREKKIIYYLIQLYTSYSEFARIHTDFRGWTSNLLDKLLVQMSTQL